MDIDVSEFLVDSYTVVQRVFHSVVMVGVLLFVLGKVTGENFLKLSDSISFLYGSRTTLKLIRLAKVFRVTAVFPILALLLIYSFSELFRESILLVAGFLWSPLDRSWSSTFHELRFAREDEIAYIISRTCLPSCIAIFPSLDSVSLGDFSMTLAEMRNKLEATSPEVYGKTQSAQYGFGEYISSVYSALCKILVYTLLFFVVFRSKLRTRWFPNVVARGQIVRLIFIVLAVSAVLRWQWEADVERTVSRSFSLLIAASTKTTSIRGLEDIEDKDGRDANWWREKSLVDLDKNNWLRYEYAQLRSTFCLWTYGTAEPYHVFWADTNRRCPNWRLSRW